MCFCHFFLQFLASPVASVRSSCTSTTNCANWWQRAAIQVNRVLKICVKSFGTTSWRRVRNNGPITVNSVMTLCERSVSYRKRISYIIKMNTNCHFQCFHCVLIHLLIYLCFVQLIRTYLHIHMQWIGFLKSRVRESFKNILGLRLAFKKALKYMKMKSFLGLILLTNIFFCNFVWIAGSCKFWTLHTKIFNIILKLESDA